MEINNSTNNAGYFIRLFAHLLESLLVLAFATFPILLLVLYYKGNKSLLAESTSVANNLILVSSLFLILSLFGKLYRIYAIPALGAEIGKLLFGLKIRDQTTNELLDKKTTFYRMFCGYTFSSAFVGLGYLSIFKNPQNLAWHDRLFNTKVTREKSPAVGILMLPLLIIYFVYFIGMVISLF